MSILLASTATANWTKPLPNNNMFGFCVAYGQVWLGHDTVYGYDQVTGELQYQLTGFNGNVRAVQPFDGGLVALSIDGNIYKADIEGNAAPRAFGRYNTEPGWVQSQAGSVYFFAQKTGVCRIAPTNGGQVILDVPNSEIQDFPVLAPDAVLVPRKPNFIDVTDPLTLAIRSTITIPGLTITGFSGGASNGPVTFFILREKTLIALDATLQTIAWRVEVNAKLTVAAAADPKFCYAGTSDGRIFVFDAVTGKAVRQLRLGSGAINSIFQDDGLVYAVCTEKNDTFIYAADPQTGTVIKHRTGQNGYIIGIDNGVVYYQDIGAIGAVRLADIVREFYAESVLVQDFAFASGNETKKPSVHSEITLYDRSGSPWATQTVMVGCTSPITIKSGGVSFNIDAKTAAPLKTDSTGKLRIDMPAGDVDSKGVFRSGLTSPALTLLTSFMDPDDRVLVRPDAQLHDELGKVTQARLQTAKGYDGNLIVVDKYRKDNKIMTNVAGMIGATSSMVKDSLENRKTLLAAAGKRYLAPGCDMGTICCCKAGNYQCKLVCNRAFAFDLDPARSTFGYFGSKQDIERWLKDHPVSHENLLMSWGDFWDAVKSGAAKVKNAIVYAARQVEHAAKDVVKTVVTAVINGIERTMDFVVDTVEHAIGIIHGIFNEIVGAIDKVLETLSLIFNWDGIVSLKNDIKANIGKAFDRLLKPQTEGGKSLLTQAREKGDQAFADMRSKLNRALDDLDDRIGKQSGSGVQQHNAGPNSPAKGGASSNWLQSKMNDNLLSEQAIKTHALAAAPGSAIHIPAFTLPGDLQNEISRFVDDLQGRVTGDVKTSLDRLKSALGPSNDDLFAQSFHFFLELVRGAINVGLDILAAVFDGAMRLLEKILAAAWSYIRDETITIPFVSDLYRSLTRSDLTGLDLACLLVAVPASLAIAAVSSGRRALAGAAQLSGILGGVAQIVWSMVSAGVGALSATVADKLTALSPTAKVIFGAIRGLLLASFGLAARGLLLWSDIETNEGNDDALAINTILWCFPTLAVLADLVANPLALAFSGIGIAEGTAIIVCVFGLCLGVFLALFAIYGRMKAPMAITFNALVAAGLIVRLGTVFEPLWVKLVAVVLGGGFICASGVVKVIDASGVAAAPA
ncbi:PQQ-binding-like beta-propeller repeat protein [Bradyrhizobium prioriisuperbiae]|uniref:outer membrane protein assembly factor BamB family protein n=1 Tax=Bradyrhizobium prioriisuperbiae TaxID=2854389 RepID=UPI0028EAD9D7|nr:PQQ-binding-like beta-propeller repeat protein [Bradyrhizobium prioritasuperba]